MWYKNIPPHLVIVGQKDDLIRYISELTNGKLLFIDDNLQNEITTDLAETNLEIVTTDDRIDWLQKNWGQEQPVFVIAQGPFQPKVQQICTHTAKAGRSGNIHLLALFQFDSQIPYPIAVNAQVVYA